MVIAHFHTVKKHPVVVRSTSARLANQAIIAAVWTGARLSKDSEGSMAVALREMKEPKAAAEEELKSRPWLRFEGESAKCQAAWNDPLRPLFIPAGTEKGW
jgi:hypothetical protein